MIPDLSIAIAYYNRKPLFMKTLEVLDKYETKNFEVVVVDDASEEEHRLEDIVNNFSIDINLIRINPEEKAYINPCVPFNIAFRNSRADKIIIQNPECIHVGPVLTIAEEITKKNVYNTFACWAAGEEVTEEIINFSPETSEFAPLVRKTIDRFETKVGDTVGITNCWYNHFPLRQVCYHFASCITKEDLYDLGGFDERYANGVGFDDDELLHRANKKGMKIQLINDPMVVHLFHGLEAYQNSESRNRFQFNKNILDNSTKKEEGWRVNCLLDSKYQSIH